MTALVHPQCTYHLTSSRFGREVVFTVNPTAESIAVEIRKGRRIVDNRTMPRPEARSLWARLMGLGYERF